jgi:hypothetical protein
VSERPESTPKGEDADLEGDIRADRKFSLSEAIGRMAGSDLMKGASPVTGKRQAELAIQDYRHRHLTDAGGVLGNVLLRHMRRSNITAPPPALPHRVCPVPLPSRPTSGCRIPAGAAGTAPRHRQGIAGGVLACARNTGMVLGVALAAVVFTTVLAHAPADGTAPPIFHAIDRALLVATAMALVGIVTSAVR